MKQHVTAFLVLHWHDIATAFVLSGGLWIIYAWLVLAETHTQVSRMFDDVFEERGDQ